MKWVLIIFLLLYLQGLNCKDPVNPIIDYPGPDRRDKLPDDITKQRPDSDPHPPVLHSSDYQTPVPLPSAVNTRGAEDSPFILPNGRTLYFFFTPDVRKPAQEQVLDSVTGVWVASKSGGIWNQAERVWLQDADKPALDGAVCIQNDEMWFASVREGYTGVNMFTARRQNDTWTNWQYAGDRLMKDIGIGEVHLYQDTLYFHSDRSGGTGGLDIWTTVRNGGNWTDPVNLETINSSTMDGYPFVSQQGDELWFTRTYQGTPAVFRSRRVNGQWKEPELILSTFAGEPSLDTAGNLYFVHHYYQDDKMIEADIYVAYKN